MRQFILFTARADNGSSPWHRKDLISRTIDLSQNVIKKTFPSILDIRTSSWVSSNGHVGVVWATNEPEVSPQNPDDVPHGTPFVGIEGYLTSQADVEILRDSREPLESSLDFGGCFTAFVANESGISAITDAGGSGGAYWVESQNLRILSSRSLLAHLVAQADDQASLDPRIELNALAIRNMANSGYLHSDRSAFVGVQSVPCQSSLRMNSWGSKFRTIDRPFKELSDDDSWEPPFNMVESVSEKLVDAFRPLRGQDLALSLTGGRDSRILLAATKHVENLTVRTQTRGEPDNPDVVLAKQLADILKVPHELQLPERAAPNILLGEDPSTRITRVVDMHDWSVSAWDDAPDYGPYSTRPSMSGVGGEILRGGLVRINVDHMDGSQLSAALLNVFAGAAKNFLAPVNEAAKFDGSYYSGIARNYPYEASDRFYRLERNNRWVACRRSAARLRSNAIDPLLDNRFLQEILELPARYRWQERLAFDVINYLAPEISDVPIEGYRWRFDRNIDISRLSEKERDGWEQRVAVSKPSGAGIKPWHTLEAPSVRKIMKDFIIDKLDTSDYGIFDKSDIVSFMERDSFSHPSRVWHIATALHMLDTCQEPLVRIPRRPQLEIHDAPGLANSGQSV